MTQAQSLWWGTLTLTAAAVLSRGLGLIYRMLLARYLGPEGLGLFQMVFPFYITLVTLVAAGTPVAVSQMVAEGRAPVAVISRTASVLVLAIALPLALLVMVMARPLALAIYHDAAFIPLLIALSPALLLVAGSSVLRGLFIGQQSMTVPAGSQVAEQLVRVLLLAFLMGYAGVKLAGSAPLLAVILIPVGEAVSLLVLWTGWKQSRPLAPQRPVGKRRVMGDLARLALPISLSRILGSSISLVEAAWIPRQLELSGLGQGAAIAFFGKMTGMAMPLIFFPTALTLSLSTNLVPAVARDISRPEVNHQRLVKSLGATAIWAFPVSALMLATGTRLDDLLFATHLSPLLFVPLTLGGVFLYFDIVFSGVLRGLGRTDLPLRNDLIASGVELALILLLASRPGSGPLGVVAAVSFGFVLCAILNYASLARLLPRPVPWMSVGMRPLAASLPILLVVPSVVGSLTPRLGAALGLGLGVILAAGLYIVGLRLMGTRLTRLT